jgi:aspartate racemase
MGSPIQAPTKVLGVLGGMGPAATAEFLRLLSADSPAARDQEHPIVYVLSDAQIPDRSSSLMGRGDDPGPRIKDDLDKLVSWGADVCAVPCNTAHVFIDPIIPMLNIPLIHIVEASLSMAAEVDPTGAWLCATEGTVRSGLYQRHAGNRRYGLRFPDASDQKGITEIVGLVKANRIDSAAERIADLSEKLWKIDDKPLLLACTEIPLAYGAAGLPERMGISSLQALARACVRYLYSFSC